MPAPKIAVIVGSLRKESHNLKLAQALVKLGQGRFEAEFVSIGDLPLFNEDLEKQPPASVTKMKSAIEGSAGVLVVTPEYNRSAPGVLKNAIDWASRPYGKNSFAKKPLAIIGMSPGNIGTAVSQNSLKPIFSYLDTALMGQPEIYLQYKDGFFAADGSIGIEKTQEFLKGFVDKFLVWIGKHAPLAQAA